MTTLIDLQSLSKSFGSQILFEKLSLTLKQSERIGLIGPNGSGKSTLLKIISGRESADLGTLSMRQGTRIAYAAQDPQFAPLSLMALMCDIDGAIGSSEELQTRAAILLNKAQLSDSSRCASTLSGGEKKRLDIARALMVQPDLLLLDEPTNHLDLAGINWLENLLNKEKIAFLTVSHDRYFLQNVCGKIIELNRCYRNGLFICEGPMSSFIEQKADYMHAQRRQERALRSIVRQESNWLQRSPQARSVKSRSRIANAYNLMEELEAVKGRTQKTKVWVDFEATEKGTRKLLSGKNIAKAMGEKLLFEGITLTLTPKSRLGIVGNNGSGKTTLLKILAGLTTADKGTIKYADNLNLVYFDQHLKQLSSEQTLRQALSMNSDYVTYRGKQLHINSWAKKFLFTPERLKLNVGSLSGGERARLLIAKLMLKPADILFLDEPTNDLDIDTLEVIEASLNDFAGAVVLITHDRCLMERLCSQYLLLDPAIEPQLFADYSRCEAEIAAKGSGTKRKAGNAGNSKPIVSSKMAKREKLSYMEKKELAGMEEAITLAEKEIEALQLKAADGDIAADSEKSLKLYTLLAQRQNALEALFSRWEELSDKSQQFTETK